MKKPDKNKVDDDLRDEYDLPNMQGAVRGKYARRYAEGSNLVVLLTGESGKDPASDANTAGEESSLG